MGVTGHLGTKVPVPKTKRAIMLRENAFCGVSSHRPSCGAFMSGGAHQGLHVGDVFAIMHEGDKVTSQQTGFTITLPGTQIGRLRIISLFGDAEANEGAVGEIISGTIDPTRLEGVYVVEERRN